MSASDKITTLEYSQKAPPAQRRAALMLDGTAIILAALGICSSFLFMELLHASLIPQMVLLWGLCTAAAAVIVCLRKTALRNIRRMHVSVLIVTLVSLGLGVVSLSVALTAVDPHLITRNQVNCDTHLRGIYGAMMLYANDHDGSCPDSLAALAQKELNDGDEINVFVSPAAQPLGYQSVPTTQEILADLRSNSPTYIYLARGMKFPPSSSTVLIYDAASNHTTLERGGDGVHVLYGDGTVKWFEGRAKQTFLKQIEAQTASSKTN